MKKYALLLITFLLVLLFFHSSLADTPESVPEPKKVKLERTEATSETEEMLKSLLELRKNLKQQIKISKTKQKKSSSDAEKSTLKEEITHLDQQLSETSNDFERIATGVESAIFVEKKPETFSWKEEVASLVEPAIKELKRFTIRARQKSDLKDKIQELEVLLTSATQAGEHLQSVLDTTEDKKVKEEVEALQPEWSNIVQRLVSKLELAQTELEQLTQLEVSLVETSSNSLKNFFKNRGLYLIMAIGVFVVIILVCRLSYRAVVELAVKINRQKKQRSFNLRLLHLLYKVFSVLLAVLGLFFVLYLAEDWFLLSLAIIFFLGVSWTIRQGLPKLWQQGRIMLNVGSVRENERLVLHGVPWRVDSLNVFCKLSNPSLGTKLRIPIEDMVGLVSRPYHKDEPWFPCKKGDWVIIGNTSRARVVNLSHEQVEVVERGGRHVIYPTQTFLSECPAVLSRNFRIRIPFGISYKLQKEATSTIPTVLKGFLEKRMKDEGYTEHCHNLQVEFFQANASSLDLIVLADFDGQVADILKRLERAIQRWCVECCTEEHWEIPFPQLTLHKES